MIPVGFAFGFATLRHARVQIARVARAKKSATRCDDSQKRDAYKMDRQNGLDTRNPLCGQIRRFFPNPDCGFARYRAPNENRTVRFSRGCCDRDAIRPRIRARAQKKKKKKRKFRGGRGTDRPIPRRN